ncbi:unnamed protein product [Thlaspi arvense]|uniref:Uncharacterized protein n=1 Tax=Thlaspi arvense TaxID=13288 RepID=A0AAU9T5N1_THLAR|nr:unnamed protein product [Thlaspi arvense]
MLRDYGTEGRKIQNPQIPPSRGIQLRMSIREREIKDLELIYLSSNEREFPSLSQRLIHAANQINPRRSYRDMAAN